jgi:transcriptional regulator with XRE-family HTH domain
MLRPMRTSAGGAARLGRFVRLERQRQGLRQGDLARQAGVSRNTITALEAGHTHKPKSLPEILAALGMSPSELILDGPPSAPAPGSAPPLAHLSDAQLGHEAVRLLIELTSRLMARPPATAIPPAGHPGMLSAVADTPPADCPDTAE